MDLKIWRMKTRNGTREYYRAFQQEDWSGYSFIKPIAPTNTTSCEAMFYDYIGTHLPGNLDFSGLKPTANIGSLFTWSTSLVEIYDIGLPAMNSYHYTFNQAYKLKKIHVLRAHENTTFAETFLTTSALEEITFEGVIGKNLTMSSCPKLTHDSLMNIISCLKDYSEDTSGTVHSLNIGSANLSKLTFEEQQIAIDKGWTIA